MLKSIFVKNFILIEEASIDFNQGYSVFTGETGAGKSLLIDAISVLCGGRFLNEMIQNGSDSAIIEAVFDIDSQLEKKLSDAGYNVDDGILIVSREINRDGKSTSRINNRVTTLSLIKTLLENEIDIHGQNDTQYLLNNRYHLDLLDAYINNDVLVDKVSDLYKVYKKYDDEYEHLSKEVYNEKDLELLEFEVDEIENLVFDEKEIAELEEKQRTMAAFEKTSVKVNDARNSIDKADIDAVYDVAKLLDADNDAQLKGIGESLKEAYYLFDEAKNTLDTYIENMYFDENEYDEIQRRLYEINRIIHKHGSTYKQFELTYHNMKERIRMIKDRDTYLKECQANKIKAYELFYDEATRLRKVRKNAAESLKTAVMKELHDLSLENARFEIEFSEIINRKGIDNVEFMISMNPGEAMKSLAKVASGGELSRLMLGLKTIFNQLQGISTIIFDEIDSGVSGKVAYSIGKKMKKIADNAQVFSVTHLAPVAAFADTHYRVIKKVNDNKTTTSIKVLKGSEIIEELAQIATGSNSESSLVAASDLYNRAQNDFNKAE